MESTPPALEDIVDHLEFCDEQTLISIFTSIFIAKFYFNTYE